MSLDNSVEETNNPKILLRYLICVGLGIAILVIYIFHFKGIKSVLREKGCLITATAPSKVYTLEPEIDGRLLSVKKSAPGGLEWVSPNPPVPRYFVYANFINTIGFTSNQAYLPIPTSSFTKNSSFGFSIITGNVPTSLSAYHSLKYDGLSVRTFLCTYTGIVQKVFGTISPHFSVNKGGGDCLILLSESEKGETKGIITGSTMLKLNINDEVYVGVKSEQSNSFLVSSLDISLVELD